MIQEKIDNIDQSTEELRKFSLVISIALILVGGYLGYYGSLLFLPLFFGAFLLLLLGACCPSVLKPLQKGWMTLAILIGWLVSRVVISFMFYFVLTPIGLFGKAVGKEFLQYEISEGEKSYWNDRDEPDRDPSYYEKQY